MSYFAKIRANTLPSRAIMVAARGTACPLRATAYCSDLQAFVFKRKQVSDMKFCPKPRFRQQKQGLGLFGSLLRKVWKKI